MSPWFSQWNPKITKGVLNVSFHDTTWIVSCPYDHIENRVGRWHNPVRQMSSKSQTIDWLIDWFGIVWDLLLTNSASGAPCFFFLPFLGTAEVSPDSIIYGPPWRMREVVDSGMTATCLGAKPRWKEMADTTRRSHRSSRSLSCMTSGASFAERFWMRYSIDLGPYSQGGLQIDDAREDKT